jgi:hypothetical protein
MVVAAAVGIFLVFNLMTFERGAARATTAGKVRGYKPPVAGGLSSCRSIGNLPPEERVGHGVETLRCSRACPATARRRPVRRYLVLARPPRATDGRPA